MKKFKKRRRCMTTSLQKVLQMSSFSGNICKIKIRLVDLCIIHVLTFFLIIAMLQRKTPPEAFLSNIIFLSFPFLLNFFLFRHDPNLFFLLLRLEFQRITAQQTQIHLRSSCGSILVHWTKWPDLSFSLSPLFVSLVMANKNRGGAFFWPKAFSHDRISG